MELRTPEGRAFAKAVGNLQEAQKAGSGLLLEADEVEALVTGLAALQDVVRLRRGE